MSSPTTRTARELDENTRAETGRRAKMQVLVIHSSHQHYEGTRSVEHRQGQCIARGGSRGRGSVLTKSTTRYDYYTTNRLSNRSGNTRNDDKLQVRDARGAATTMRHMARAERTENRSSVSSCGYATEAV